MFSFLKKNHHISVNIADDDKEKRIKSNTIPLREASLNAKM